MNKILLFILTVLSAGCNQKQQTTSQPPERAEWRLWSASWSPTNDQLIVGGTQDTLRLFSKDFQLNTNYPFAGTITKAKWHPTQNKVAVAVQDGLSKPTILHLENDVRIELDSITTYGARAIGWNTNGDLLAVGDYEGSLLIFDADGNLLTKIDTGQKAIIGLDWHPTKNLLVMVGERISIYNMNTGRLVSYEDRAKDVLMLCVAWHLSGDFFVTGDYGDFEYHYPPLLQYWTDKGQNIKSIVESKAEYRNLQWSSDGELLATASEKIRLWSKDGTLLAGKTTESLLWGIDWNSDGSKLVTTSEKGKIVIWDKALTRVQELKY